MKHVVYKFFMDFEKEEKWLNKMSAKGSHAIDYSFPGRYLFEEGKPGEYVYRLELLENFPNHPGSKVYLQFMEDSGAEVVATHVRWVLFRKQTFGEPFEIYTDNSSKYNHYKRIALMVGVVGGFNLLNGINVLNSAIRYRAFEMQILAGLCLVLGVILASMTFSYLRTMRRLKAAAKVFE